MAPQYGATTPYLISPKEQRSEMRCKPDMSWAKDSSRIHQRRIGGREHEILGSPERPARDIFERSARDTFIVAEGGVANIALDAIYPTLTGHPGLDGDHTYNTSGLSVEDSGGKMDNEVDRASHAA